MPVFSFGQTVNKTIYGESLWRNQGYGVANHNFDIKNYLIDEMDEYPLNPDPTTAACPYEIYTSEVMPLYDQEDEYNNTLKIRPYSINNYTDYTNGVSAQDLLAIANHLIGNPSFESRSPTEDFPFRYISGDADYDNDVDLDDADMIQDLLLGYRYDLERNSWEWVHKEEVEDAEERFEESPYDFVIDYNWPGSEGIILPGLSTDQIEANNGDYFDFRTTKIGDIVANSSWTYPSANSWVCGSGSYFSGGEVSTRSIDNSIGTKVRAGTIVKVAVDLNVVDDIYAIQLPISFSEKDYELVGVDFAMGYNPRWNYNPIIQSLVVLDFAKHGDPLIIPRGKLAEITLKAKHEIRNVQSSISWNSEWNVEIIGKDESQLNAELKLEIIEIIPSELFLEIRYDGGYSKVYIESPKGQMVSMKFFTYQGQPLYEDQIVLNRGENYFQIPNHYLPGLYLVCVNSINEFRLTKLCIW